MNGKRWWGFWVGGLEKFLHWDSCQCLGGDYVLKVHAAVLVIERGRLNITYGPVDEESRRLFALES